jgi:uncharacterized protein
MGTMLPIKTLYRMARIAAAAALTLAVLIQAAVALDVPPLRGRVNDYAGMLSQGVVRQVDLLLKDLEDKDSTQIVVLTVPSLEGEALEDFSLRIAEQWKIGHKGLDNGAILLITRAERKVRIEVGYGLEGRLTDLQAGRIIRRIIVPEFQAGRFDQGVISGVQAMVDMVRGEFTVEDRKDSGGLDLGDFTEAIPLLFLFVFLVFSLGRASRPLGTAAGGFLMPFFGHIAYSPGLKILAALAGVGLVAGFIFSVFASLAAGRGSLPSGRRSVGGYSEFPRRFPSGGGFSTGGGGFSRGGGLSGGGGGFGGGGASGTW